MTTVVAIVEGDGEMEAFPVLLKRLATWIVPEQQVSIDTPIRVRRNRFLKRDEEFRRIILLAAAKSGDRGFVILLDADDDCPAVLAPQIHRRASAVIPHRRISVVLANREYEAWFVAAANSLNG